MPRFLVALVTAVAILQSSGVWAEPTFVNGLVIPGDTLDATQRPGANAGRLGFFSDIYYDPERNEWWALSDRGPGGGVLDYATRVQRFTIDVHPVTGRISRFRVKETIPFTDPQGLLTAPTATVGVPKALNGLNSLLLNGNVGVLGRSFDPEGLVVDPRTCHFIVGDEYGPSIYEFSRKGKLLRVFQTPANLVPKVNVNPIGLVTNYVAERGTGLIAGRQDNRGFEGLAITPDGKKLYAVLQDPLVNEPPSNNGRDGRNVRIVVFDNDRHSPTYGTSIAQYAYQLEPQAAVLARIAAAGQVVPPNDLRQGRNIGLSAILAINEHEFLVLERDNRGIGVEDPNGVTVTGSKRIFKIDIRGATDVTNVALPIGALPAGVTPVAKSLEPFIDLAANTVLPNGKQAEKWEGIAIGPRLKNGAHLILTGNDNDYSVTQQAGSSTQFDVYVNFEGASVLRDLDQPTMLNGQFVGPPPDDHVLIPGVLHAYKASAADLAGYVKPGRDGHKRHDRDDDDCDEDRGGRDHDDHDDKDDHR